MSENKFEGLQAWLQKAAGKLSANIYINVIKEAMLAYMPFTIIASIPLIISNFPYQPFSDFITGIVGSTVCMSVYFATINIAALLVCITTSYTLAKKLKINELQAVLTALVSFLIVTPLGEGKSITNVSASSMFTCMIVSMVAVKLYKAICDKDIKIKMPESVPPAVAAPFESLVPTASVVFLFLLVSCIMTAFGTDLNSFINGTIGLPIMLVGGSIFGVVFAKVFEQALWFFGIHGGSIVSGVMTPVLQVLETQNLEAVTAGGAPINIISNSFFSHFCSIGLVGAVIAALICARSKQYKEISRIAIGPYVFGVSNTVSALIAYAAFALKLVPIPTGLIQLPWTTPVILSGMLVTQSWKGAVLQLVQLVVATAFWLPFMISADKDVLASEQGE